MSKCILCDNLDVQKLTKVSCKELSIVYRKLLDRDISTEFGESLEIMLMHCNRCDLKFFHPPLAGSPRFYEALSKQPGANYYLGEKSEYAFAGKMLERAESVLDVGCGVGCFSKYVKGSFTGLDFNPAAQKIAEKANLNVICQSLEEHLVECSGRYSAVCAFQVLEHVPDPKAFLNGCLRALRPEGLLVLSVPSEDSFVPLQENAVLNMPPHHITRWTDKCLTNLGDLFDLELLRLEHEELSEVHFEPFVQCVTRRMVRDILRWKTESLIDLSLKSRVVARLSRSLQPFFCRLFSKSVWPHGHSITAILRKYK